MDRERLKNSAVGVTLKGVVAGLIDALDPDRALEAAQQATGLPDPLPEAIRAAARKRLEEAARPIAANPGA